MTAPRTLAWNLGELAAFECGAGTSAGIALQAAGARRIAWIPRGRDALALDVTDPRAPRSLASIRVADRAVTGVSVVGNLLGLATEGTRGGLSLYDVTTPEAPRPRGTLALGDGDGGAASVQLAPDGLAHLAARFPHRLPDAARIDPRVDPRDPRDDWDYAIADVHDPDAPQLLSRWSVPATTARRVDARFDTGRRVHAARVAPSQPDRAYVACGDAGIAVLDIGDPAQPRTLVVWSHSPPYHGATHAIAPLLPTGYALVADQPVTDDGSDWPKRVWMVDLRAGTKAMSVGMLPVPPREAFAARAGRFGAYGLSTLGDIALVAFGSGGVRLIDVADPYTTVEIGYFAPAGGEIVDVVADDRDVVYAVDRRGGRLYTLALEL